MVRAVRIYRPAKTAMQSGRGLTGAWALEFDSSEPTRPDPLMGWARCDDTRAQVRLTFPSAEDAIAYAQREGLAYRLERPQTARPPLRSYADNFRPERLRR